MYTYRAKVVRVVDGDTVILDIDLGFDVWLNSQSVRLSGVDTPETRTRNANEKKAGLLAKKWVSDLLKVGDDVKITTILDKEGKFGRILGVITNSNEVNINEGLINNRYAVPYEGQSKEEIIALHQVNIQHLIDTNQI